MELLMTPAGSIRCVYGEAVDLSELGRLSIQRGSHVEPTSDGRWTADLSPVAAGEIFEAGGQAQSNAYDIEMHYISDVTTKCRVKYGTRYFDIEGITNREERGRRMILRAVETDE